MKITRLVAAIGVIALGAGADVAGAQSQRIPIRKDAPTPSTTTTTTTSATTTTTTTSGEDVTWAGPLGYTLRPGAQPVYCRPEDESEVARIAIRSNLYATGMISPEQAKAIALCAVPGQIASGEMNQRDGRTVYQVNILPTRKQTESKVDVDANTGEVVNAKQLGGLRGLASYLRESYNRKKNKTTAPM